MSIASKLQDILAAKADIKDAINAKGGEVTADTPLADYAQAIEDLPSGSDEDLIGVIENSIVTLDIPSGTTAIGVSKFSNCTRLTSITIPNSVTSIGNGAFQACAGLTSITIPNSVTTIGNSVFQACTGLTLAEFGSGLTSIGNNTFYIVNTAITLKMYATIPPSLGSNTFSGNMSLKKIYVPDASVNDYKTASNWSAYASYIYPLSDYTP